MMDITISRPVRSENLPSRHWYLTRVEGRPENIFDLDHTFEIRTPAHTFRTDVFGVVARIELKEDADLIMTAAKNHGLLLEQLEKAKDYLALELARGPSNGEMADMIAAIENTIQNAGGF